MEEPFVAATEFTWWPGEQEQGWGQEQDEGEDLEALVDVKRYCIGVLLWLLLEDNGEHPFAPEAECQLCLPSIYDWGLWHVKCQVSSDLLDFLFQVLMNSTSMVPM